MLYECGEVKCPNILGVVLRFWVVGKVRRDGVGVVVYAGDHVGALLPVEGRSLNAGACSTSSTEQVDI